MELYGEERKDRSQSRLHEPQAMFFDNAACFWSDSENGFDVRTGANGANNGSDWQAQQQQLHQQRFNEAHIPIARFTTVPSNDLQLADNQSTAYSCGHSEGHIYEEVGPPSHTHHYHTEPYMLGDAAMNRIVTSPASLCSMCSNRCNGHDTMNTCTTSPLPCQCMSQRPLQIPCCTVHSSISNYQITPMTLPHTCQMVPAAAQNCTLHHHGCLHQAPPYIEQRYTGTLPTDDQHINDSSSESNNQHGRSLSPFNLLRKCNRDSKASTNTMLDNSSSKSLLMPCSRKMLIGVAVTLIVILVISISVGVVVTISVDKTEKVSNPSKSSAPMTSRILGTLRVTSGTYSRYDPNYSWTNTDEFNSYNSQFKYQVTEILKKKESLREIVDYTQVVRLRKGSVIVDFIVHLKRNLTQSESNDVAGRIKTAIYSESNTTNSFSRNFPISLESLITKPLFSDEFVTQQNRTPRPDASSTSPRSQKTSTVTTTVATTTKQTPDYVILPPSGVCQPINDSVCQQIHYNKSGTTFPNFAGHQTQAEANVMITIINAIMATTSCYDHLNTFSCALLAPKCGHNGTRIPPCRSMCQAAVERCGTYMSVVMDTIGTKINCSYFPDSRDPEVCVDENAPVVPTAPPTCPDNYFSCDNHTCHAMKDRCDSVKDCADHTDEQNCDGFQCVYGQFKCSNNKCLPKVWRCDGRDDCGDSSDEEGCEPVGSCKTGEFKCANGYDVWNETDKTDECIEGNFTCDKTKDCTDGSDEDEDFCRDRQ